MQHLSTDARSLVDSFYASVDDLSPGALDALPFGAIQLDGAGGIIRYNITEGLLAGLDPARVIGKNFFVDVAPCTDVAAFRGRFEKGVQQKKLFEKFRYRFLFKKMPHRDVLITLFYSERTESTWVTVHPL